MSKGRSEDYRRGDGRRDRYRDERDDRYDRPRPAPPPSEGSGGNTAVMIVGIVGGVLVVFALVCGGLGYYVFYSAKQGAARAEEKVVNVVEKQQDQFDRNQEQMRKWMDEERKKMDEQIAQEEKERKEQQAKALLEGKEKTAQKRKATDFANSFVTEAKSGRTDEAYAMTTAAYRKRVSKEQFTEQVRENTKVLRAVRAFDGGVVIRDEDLEPPFNYSTITAFRGKNGPSFAKVEVTVVKEGDGWKIDQFFAGERE